MPKLPSQWIRYEAPDTEAFGWEAALYFYDILVGLCKMARSLDDFFADKEKLELSIKTRTPLLLKA